MQILSYNTLHILLNRHYVLLLEKNDPVSFSNMDEKAYESSMSKLYKMLPFHQFPREHALDINWALLEDIQK